MNTPLELQDKSRRMLRQYALPALFMVLMVGIFFLLRAAHLPDGTIAQRGVYTIGCSMLLAAGATGFVFLCQYDRRVRLPLWACPLAAAGLSLFVLCMLYAWIGVWPLGEKSVMLVDMHHQYGPLLSELRYMLLHGENFTYSFHIGLGVNFLPTFAYYLASPLNLLLVLFPQRFLTEGILVITLLKNAAAAAAFTACAQYLYRRRDGMMVAAGVLYASMMYMLAYSWNIMWLDVVALLPLVVLCMERMLRTGKWMAYTLTLALALFANYYIGFMLCIFLVLYMLVWLARQPRTLRQCALGCWRFGYGSLLGGGLTAALLVPTALALGRTSAAGDSLPKFDSNFPIFDLLSQFFYGAEPTVRSGNLPNLYCGVVVVLLVPLYFCQKKIPLRRRLSYGALAAVMLLSCTITQWDRLWHGLHAPNDLPYRFSFLTCFAVLLLAAHAMVHLRDVKPKHLCASLAASALYLVIWERFGGEDNTPAPWLVYVNLLLLAIYALVLALGAARRHGAPLPRQAVAVLLLTVICAELIIGGTGSIDALNENEYYTNHGNYVDNASTTADAAAIKRAQELAEEDGEVFCRVERLPRFTCMDTALHHYAGITTFASSNPYQTARFMGRLGYAFNGVNSYLYNSFVPVSDALFGIRYVVLKSNIANHAQLELVDSLSVQGETRYIYRNRAALPIGFAADADILEYRSTDYAPFKNQEQVYSGLLGYDAELYTALDIETDGSGASITGSNFYKPATYESTTYSATVDEKGQYFAFVECRAADALRVETYKDYSQQNSWSVTTHEPYVIDMGTLLPDQQIQVTVEAEGGVSGNISLVRLNRDTFNETITALSAGGLQITEQSATHMAGTVEAAEDGVLFFSIPYDSGWTVEIDGQAVETLAVDPNEKDTDGALLAARLTAGHHDVTLTFRAKGQTVGLLVSLVSMLCLAAAALWPRFGHRLQKKTAVPAAAAQEDAAPAEEPAAETPAEEPTDDTPADTQD